MRLPLKSCVSIGKSVGSTVAEDSCSYYVRFIFFGGIFLNFTFIGKPEKKFYFYARKEISGKNIRRRVICYRLTFAIFSLLFSITVNPADFGFSPFPGWKKIFYEKTHNSS